MSIDTPERDEGFGNLEDLGDGDLESQEEFEDLHPAEEMADEVGLPVDGGSDDLGAEEFELGEEEPDPEEGEEEPEEELEMADDTAQQIAQQTIADLENQLREATQTNQTLMNDRVSTELTQVTSEIDSLQKDLVAAIEEGDAKTQAEVHVKVTSATARKAQLEQYKPDAPSAPTPQKAPAPGGHVVSRYPKANEYLAINTWVGSPTHGPQTQTLQTIDRALMAEGFHPSTDEYYVELASRMDRRYPGLMKLKTAKSAPVKEKKAKKAATKPVLSADRGRVSRKTKKRQKTTLMEEDREVMLKFGLDPRNPEHRTSFLKNKHERLRSETQRA